MSGLEQLSEAKYEMFEHAKGKSDLRSVRRNASQMSNCIDKMLALKFPQIGVLQWVVVLTKFGTAFNCEY